MEYLKYEGSQFCCQMCAKTEGVGPATHAHTDLAGGAGGL